tara:strand:- start:226 stop:777 length:552 start_codon:yes stop_codon:yes gene_type:complete
MSKKNELLYIMSPGCGWCKKSDPVVEELKSEGYLITTLDMTKDEDVKKAQEAKAKHNAQCGTPLFLDSGTGNQVCGFREKDIIKKWADGEKIPAPPPRPRPQQPVNPQQQKENRELRLGIYQEAKQHLLDKFYNEFEVWNTWHYSSAEERPSDCPVSKKPSFPTHKAIKAEADKILEFIKESN